MKSYVNPTKLGRSLHQAGNCYAGQGQYAEALPPISTEISGWDCLK
jgi:hypothetical protein